MSQTAPNGPYIYQPFGMQHGKDRWLAGRIYGIGGLGPMVMISGLTKSEAEAVLRALTPADAPPAETPQPKPSVWDTPLSRELVDAALTRAERAEAERDEWRRRHADKLLAYVSLMAERDALQAELATRPTWQQWAMTAHAHGWMPPTPIAPEPEPPEAP
jgi:hypothetical protein